MRIPTPLIVVAMVLALPALLPYAVVRHFLFKRRRLTAAKNQACPSCGRVLGIASLREADRHWRANVDELHRAHPGAKLRLVRLVDAICVGCGARLSFREDSGHFAPTAAAG
jgi:hypothetical protein